MIVYFMWENYKASVSPSRRVYSRMIKALRIEMSWQTSLDEINFTNVI